MTLASIALLVLLGPLGPLGPAPLGGRAKVELRGGAAPIDASDVRFGSDGLRVVTIGGGEETIAWDRVAAVTGATLDASEREWIAIAEDLWRARFRIQRGDASAARPLFERHEARFRGERSETALVVAEGLLRCRLAEGDPRRAISVALDVASLRRAGIATDRYAALPEALDATTLLAPSLVPLWAPLRSEEAALLVDPTRYDDPVVRRLGELYAALLRGEVVQAGRESHPGPALLAAIAAIDTTSSEAVERSRRHLAAAVKDLPAWAQAWAGHALGRRLVESGDPSLVTDGVLELLRVAADPAPPLPDLSLRSLELAAAALRASGDAESAAVVEREIVALGGRRSPPPTESPRR
jgi:hypothetical protein